MKLEGKKISAAIMKNYFLDFPRSMSDIFFISATSIRENQQMRLELVQ
jgi:hypothetical protein